MRAHAAARVAALGGLTALILAGCLYGRTLWAYLEMAADAMVNSSF